MKPEAGEQDGRGLGQIRHLARHSALLVSSGVVSYVGAFSLNVLLARTLGKEGFGAWVVAFSLAQLASVLGLIGADWILLRQGSFYQGSGDIERFRRTLHFALVLSGGGLLVLSAILLGIAPILGQRVFGDPSIIPLLRMTALVAPVIGIRQILVYGSQAFRDMRPVALNRNILQPMFRLAATAVALAIVPSELSAYVGLLAAELALAVAAAYALNRRLPIFGPTRPIERANLMRFALPTWGSSLVEVVRGQLFPVLIGALAALSTSAVFVASRRIVVAPVSIIASINQVYSPMGSNLYLQGRKEELVELFKSITKWSLTLGFPLFCLMVLFPKEILSVFGHEFQSGSTALLILAVGVLFQFGTGPVTTTLIITGRPRLAFIDYLVVLVTEVGLSIWLIPRYGLLGAAIAKMVGTSLNNVLPLIQSWKILGTHPYRVDFWKPLVAGVTAAVAARIVLTILGFGSTVAGAAVATVLVGGLYLAILLLLGLAPQDRAVVRVLLERPRLRRSAPSSKLGSVSSPADPPGDVRD